MELILFWLISPIVLIPIMVYYIRKSGKYEKEIKELKEKNQLSLSKIESLQRYLKYCSSTNQVPYQNAEMSPDYDATQTKAEPEVNVQPVEPEPEPEPIVNVQPVEPEPEPEPIHSNSTNDNRIEVAASKSESDERTKVVLPLPQKEELNKGTVLFGIGVFFVLLSGLIFATTTWKILPSIGKVFTLLAAVVVFYLSSYIAKEKLGLRQTGITFYFLGSCFLSVTNISIAYFKWFSDSYSFTGSTGFIVVAISLIILTVCLLIGRKLYDMPVLKMVSVYMSVADVLFLTMFFTTKFSVIFLILGIYLCLMFAVIYYFEHRNEEEYLINAYPILISIYQIVTLYAIFKGSLMWAIPIVLIAVVMFLPEIYLIEESREGLLNVFNGAVVLYSIMVVIKISIDYDISITAIFVFLALFYGLIFRYIRLPKIGNIKNSATEWCSVILLAISAEMIIEDSLVVGRVDNQTVHMIHLYVILLLNAIVSLWETLKEKTESFNEKKSLYIEVLIAICATGWINKDYYIIENIIAFALILGLYFIWLIKLRNPDDTSTSKIFLIVSNIEGFALVFLNFVFFSSKWETITVILLLGFLYYLIDKNKYIYVGVAPILMLYSLLYELLNSVLILPKNEDMLREHFLLLFMIIALVVGRIRYKMLKDNREGHEGIDWIGACSLLLVGFCFDANEYIGLFAFILYLLSYYKRVRKICWQCLASVAVLLLGHFICMQPFFAIPRALENEFVISAMFIVLVLGGIIWKDKVKQYAYVSSPITLFMMFIYAIEVIDDLYYLESVKKGNVIGMIVFFLVIAGVVGLAGHFLKSSVYVISCGLLLIESSIITGSVVSPFFGITVLILGAGYGVYLYLTNRKIWIILPLLQMYLFLAIYDSVKWYVWLAVFIISLGVGIGLFKKIYSNEEGIKKLDWFTILALIPAMVIMFKGTTEWAFWGTLMCVLYVASMYNRLNGKNSNLAIYIIGGSLMIVNSIIAGGLENLLFAIIALTIGLAFGIYLFRINRYTLLVFPLMQMYAYLISLGTLKAGVWLIIYIVSMGIGMGLFRQIYYEDYEAKQVDWFTLLSVIPIVAVFLEETSKWVFCGEIMFALFILSMYKRVNSEKANKFILTASSVIFTVAIISQPFFEIPKEWFTEWILIWSWAAIMFNSMIVFKEYKEEEKYMILFVAAVISVIWQGVEAISTGRAADAIILSLCMAVLLIYSFYKKKQMWFLLAAISLVVQGLYSSRKFWLSIAWWVYILFIGVVFIAVAAKNEYNKRNNIVKEKRVLFENWSNW